MAAEDRSISDVLQDILRNVQEILRSEVRLAKTEIREEAAKTKSSAVLLGTGAVTAIFALLFLLLMIVYMLGLVMPSWIAGEKWSSTCRHDDPSRALPRWHSSTMTRSKKSDGYSCKTPRSSVVSARAWYSAK